MDTKALERFAQAARRQLLDEVGAKLEHVLATDSAELREKADAIQELRNQIKATSRQMVIDRVAYTWFNRFCALRFMDVNHYTHAGIVSPLPGNTQPEILQDAKQGHIADELKPTVNSQRVFSLLSGELPSANPQQEAYRLLLVGVCNQYHKKMPFLFEKIADYTELLMPDDLLSEASLLHAMREAMTDEVCEDIEVIGWLYQFYISEKKDQVIGKVVKSEDIPAATQLFTPNWIVKYMVQNSLGAQWLATYPQSPLRGQMEYYIEPAEQTPEVQQQLGEITPTSLDPEAMTLIDPASGSGHILVEAYELFKAFYLEKGYNQRDVAQLILEKNLFGLEICPRAAQLTGFALMMKARADDRQVFNRGIKLNVMALQDSTGFDVERLAQGVKLADYGLQPGDLTELRRLFEHATTFGSLIQVPEELAEKLPALKQLSQASSQDLFVSEALKRLGALVQQAELLAAQYDAVVANPPYMGIKAYCSALKKFVSEAYKEGKADLYAAFTLRNIHFAETNGHVGMITIPNWMFLSAFEKLRSEIFQGAPIVSLVHNGRGVWGSDFGSCSYVLQRSPIEELSGRFLRLFDKQGSVASNEELERRFHTNERFSALNAEFKKIPGSPVAYWVSDRVRSIFENESRMGEWVDSKVGLQTSDNTRFLRRWHEVAAGSTGFRMRTSEEAQASGLRWFPCNKGGVFRRWYGNHEFVVNWQNDGREIKDYVNQRYPYLNGNIDYVIKDRGKFFHESVSWSDVTISVNAFRYYPTGFIYDATGHSAFAANTTDRDSLISFCNNKFCSEVASVLNPTVHFHIGYFDQLPWPAKVTSNRVTPIVQSLIAASRTDWNAYERSWDFQSLRILTASSDPTPPSNPATPPGSRRTRTPSPR
ncbi:BREX-1 system adenine-specific DNA-methyltransferase PglX [Candidatus Bipolaricaulota bacterium]